MRFNLEAVPATGLGFYTVAFNRTGRLFVNGRLAWEIGAMREPLPMNWNRSQYAVIPNAMLHEGNNEIEIQQRAYSTDMGWLAPVRLGPDESLRPIWERRVFWQNDLVQLVGGCTGIVGIFMLIVWLGRSKEAMFFWFGLASLVWAVISLDYYRPFAPISPHAWERFIASAQVLRPVLMFVFVLRYCGLRRPLLELALWSYFVIGSIAVFGNFASGDLITLWFVGVLIASPYFLFIQVRVALNRRKSEGVMLAVAGLVQIGLSGYDLWLYSENTWTDRVYLAHFGAPLYLVVVGIILVRRFVESHKSYEDLSVALEDRVKAKADELRRNYEQLLESRRKEALAIERTRIMSEMHDGIGSQLTEALAMVRRMDPQTTQDQGVDGPVATVLRESIEDLQLIVDSLEPVDNDLLTVLGTLRYRLQERLGKGGVALNWNVVDLPALPMLTPHSVLSILRIVQEAFANCLKHAHATQISVTTGLCGEQGLNETAQIRIVDNGRGIVQSHRAGRGLESMRRRAADLGGLLKITSCPGQTEVLVEFPTLRPRTP